MKQKFKKKRKNRTKNLSVLFSLALLHSPPSKVAAVFAKGRAHAKETQRTHTERERGGDEEEERKQHGDADPSIVSANDDDAIVVEEIDSKIIVSENNDSEKTNVVERLSLIHI